MLRPRRWAVMPLLPWERAVRDLMDAADWLTPWEADALSVIAAKLNPDRKDLGTIDRIASAVTARQEGGGYAH